MWVSSCCASRLFGLLVFTWIRADRPAESWCNGVQWSFMDPFANPNMPLLCSGRIHAASYCTFMYPRFNSMAHWYHLMCLIFVLVCVKVVFYYSKAYFTWHSSDEVLLNTRVRTSYRNWPRYALRWNGLCCHSWHSTSEAGRRTAACVRASRPHECCAGSGSTNHDSADRMSGQFLFYHEHEAIHNDNSHDDYDDEPPCWTALAGNASVWWKRP